jgi:hypothetical protein
MATLLEISHELLVLRELMDRESGENGELSPEADKALSLLLAEIESKQTDKADNYTALIRQLELEASCHREEKERHAANEKSLESKSKWLKERMKQFMELHSIKEIKTPRFRLSVCGNGGVQAVDVKVPVGDLPRELQRVKVEADMDAIRKAIADGKCNDDVAVLMARGSHLRIK